MGWACVTNKKPGETQFVSYPHKPEELRASPWTLSCGVFSTPTALDAIIRAGSICVILASGAMNVFFIIEYCLLMQVFNSSPMRGGRMELEIGLSYLICTPFTL